jgi:hypothetical protein
MSSAAVHPFTVEPDPAVALTRPPVVVVDPVAVRRRASRRS